jgi:HD-GYP domain-containing protein (c-di-GMP phosphodiesterase class II)
MDEEFLALPEGEEEPLKRDRPAPRRGYRILYPLLALLVFVALAPLVTLAWKLLATNREGLVTSQQEYQLLLASSIAGQLDSHVDGQRERLESLARSFGKLVSTQGMEAFEKDLLQRPVLGRPLDKNLIALRFVTARMRSYYARSAEFELTEELQDHVDRAVDAALQAGEGGGYVSQPFLLPPMSQAAVIISSPVITDGAVVGVLVGFVDLSRVWDEVLRQDKSGHTVYAIDRHGRLFAHTDRSLVVRRADLHKVEIVERFLNAAGRNKMTMLFTDSRDGDERSYVGSFESTRVGGWGIFVQVEERYAYAPVRKMIRDTVTWSAGAILVAVLLAILFAGTLSQPVRRLTDAARAFALGDFTVRAHVHGGNEICELAENFNRMAEDIEDYIKRLKDAARENKELFLGTVRALAEAIDAKDPYTRGHSGRVDKYSVVTARYMGLDRDTIWEVHLSALLHDVGKIGIDDRVLKKPAALSPEEWEIMKQHPDKGAKIMSSVERLKSVIPGMRHHHERYVGGGYPLGLKGKDIPLAARIVMVADTFDAITTDRPYSRAKPFEAAIAHLKEIQGTQLDPEVTDAFIRAWEAGELAEEERKLSEKRAIPEPAVPASA